MLASDRRPGSGQGGAGVVVEMVCTEPASHSFEGMASASAAVLALPNQDVDPEVVPSAVVAGGNSLALKYSKAVEPFRSLPGMAAGEVPGIQDKPGAWRLFGGCHDVSLVQ
jgi:hypothetical protein